VWLCVQRAAAVCARVKPGAAFACQQPTLLTQCFDLSYVFTYLFLAMIAQQLLVVVISKNLRALCFNGKSKIM
jgi:hypothetical protein